jgi:putative phage-type endonuclease
MKQQTPEWFAARLGKATGSRISDIVSKTKTGYGSSREDYLFQLVVERLTGVNTVSYSSPAMQWGVEQEEYARSAYEAHMGVLVDQVGSIDHPRIAMSSASPDGLIGDDGMVEIKCPMTKNHLNMFLGQSIAKSYMDQMMWQMAVTGRKWVDYVSFDPRCPAGLQLFIQTIERDNEYIAALEFEVVKFLNEVELKEKDLRLILDSKI